MDLEVPQVELQSMIEPMVGRPQRSLRARFKTVLQHLATGVLLAVMAAGAYLLISHFILQSVRVVGCSMVPALHDSESYLLNRWVYHVRQPRPQDIVVLRDPSDGGFSVKRVVAVGGDTVQLKNGVVYVNGKELRETYLPPMTFTFADTREAQFTCGPDQYFVLGDNRNNSIDSRKYGPVPRGNILGMVVH